MTINLIYATWPNAPYGNHWYKMARALREAGLTARLQSLGHDVREHLVEATDGAAADMRRAFELAAQIGALVRASQAADERAVIVCGSCAIAALGAISGLGGENSAMLWMDAHADLNTPETTLSGLFEGMSVAMVLGEAWQAMTYDIAGVTAMSRRKLCFYHVRDIDRAEKAFIDEENLPIVTNAADAIGALGSVQHAYLHLDMDVHGAEHLRVKANGCVGGPSPEHVQRDLADLVAGLPVRVLSVTALDPDVADDGAIEVAIEHVIMACEAWRLQEIQP
jgi:arginase